MHHADASGLPRSPAPVPSLWQLSFIIAFGFSALVESLEHVGAIPISEGREQKQRKVILIVLMALGLGVPQDRN